ncbi:unnamed protein product [Cyclocybe aegerita]|uniref:Uncharacterized protein n=1 Tax=Cyclocybe aegerita TaxID=1973307 RepID=A0A8S0W178_CYCAE|nr:unnamed protein product [Cyclocybe aegerita]
MKVDEDKVKTLSPQLLTAYSGKPGDAIQFVEYVKRNIRLYQILNLWALQPAVAASWIWRAIAESLRSCKPYSVNLLMIMTRRRMAHISTGSTILGRWQRCRLLPRAMDPTLLLVCLIDITIPMPPLRKGLQH